MQLRDEDEMAQLAGLTDLCEHLSISTEESLAAFPSEQVVPLLVSRAWQMGGWADVGRWWPRQGRSPARTCPPLHSPNSSRAPRTHNNDPLPSLRYRPGTAARLQVGFLGYEHNPDLMLLAARALTFLADVFPPAGGAIIRHGAVPAFCARLLTIEYIDLAEQSLQVG